MVIGESDGSKFIWTHERISEAVLRCQTETESVLKKLLPWLNSIHSINKNELYWRRVIGRFVTSYVEAMYAKYVMITEDYDGVRGERAELDQSLAACSHVMDFVHKIRTDEYYNEQMSKVVCDFLGIPGELVSPPLNEASVGTVEKSLSFKAKSLSWIISLIDRGTRSPVALYITLFNIRNLLKLIVLTKFQAWPVFDLPQPKNLRHKIDSAMRSGLADIQCDNEFQSLIFASLKLHFPIEYIEGFNTIRNQAIEIAKGNVPRVIITGIGFSWSSLFSIWAAECAERGAKIVGLQHGGRYGESEDISADRYELSVVDEYISWGWSEPPKVRPLPSPRLMGYASKKHSPVGNKVLWVTTLDSKKPCFIGHVPFGERFYEYFNGQEDLYDCLNAAVKDKLSIRLYREDLGWGQKYIWEKRNPNIKYDDNDSPLHKSARESDFVIIDHFGSTSLLECLAMNIPVIVFGDPALFSISKRAKPYYDALNEAGVLHYSPESAAKAINTMHTSVDDWWNQEGRQVAVKKFQNQFGLVEKTGIGKWVSYINENLSLARKHEFDTNPHK